MGNSLMKIISLRSLGELKDFHAAFTEGKQRAIRAYGHSGRLKFHRESWISTEPENSIIIFQLFTFQLDGP